VIGFADPGEDVFGAKSDLGAAGDRQQMPDPEIVYDLAGSFN
jgi:hypothetical protein